MSNRKRKESSASLDEIKELINSKFEALEVKLTALENEFDAVQADLQNAIRVVENKADEAIEISKQNRDELESVNFRLAEQDRELADQDSKIRRLVDDIDDLKNRSYVKHKYLKIFHATVTVKIPGMKQKMSWPQRQKKSYRTPLVKPLSTLSK